MGYENVLFGSNSGKLNLRTGTGWRAFLLCLFAPPPPWSIRFSWKISKIIHAGDCFPRQIFQVDLVRVRESLFPETRTTAWKHHRLQTLG